MAEGKPGKEETPRKSHPLIKKGGLPRKARGGKKRKQKVALIWSLLREGGTKIRELIGGRRGEGGGVGRGGGVLEEKKGKRRKRESGRNFQYRYCRLGKEKGATWSKMGTTRRVKNSRRCNGHHGLGDRPLAGCFPLIGRTETR